MPADRSDAYYNYAMGHLYGELAAAYGNRGEYISRAIDFYKAAIKADPSAATLNDELAALYFQAGRGPEAIAELQDRLKKDPKALDAHLADMRRHGMTTVAPLYEFHLPVRDRDTSELGDFLAGGRVVPDAFVARIEDTHPFMHELQHVLVARHDHHIVAGSGCAFGDRADHVVRLEALAVDDRHAHRLAGGVHPRDLSRQIVGHRRAVRLVVAGELLAERGRGEIERRGDELRMLLVEELPQHRDEDVDGVGRAPLRIVQRRALRGTDGRVKRAMHLGAAVDEEECRFTGGHRTQSVYHLPSCPFRVLFPHPDRPRG